MQKYKLIYKDTPDWELTLPIFIKPEDCRFLLFK